MSHAGRASCNCNTTFSTRLVLRLPGKPIATQHFLHACLTLAWQADCNTTFSTRLVLRLPGKPIATACLASILQQHHYVMSNRRSFNDFYVFKSEIAYFERLTMYAMPIVLDARGTVQLLLFVLHFFCKNGKRTGIHIGQLLIQKIAQSPGLVTCKMAYLQH